MLVHSKFFRARLRAVLLSAAALALCQQALAVDLDRKLTFDIPAQKLSTALLQFSHQSGVQVVVGPEVGEQTTSGINGEQSIANALSHLLEPSGLTYVLVGESSISVGKSQPGKPTAAASSAGRDDLRLAQSAGEQKTNESDGDAGTQGSASGERVQEIIVTAQKRTERIQDVPIPVTAISGQSLVDANQLRLQDYYSKVPGLNYSPGQWGEPRVAIRGIVTSPYTNPTVGLMIDDIPYGLSINQNGGGGPDIDPGDLERIEVLRGPQGTLYGASSMGGLLKYMTVDPSVESLTGRIQVGATSISGGDDVGYNLRGSVNVPVSEVFALRASGFTRRDPGYVDNVQTGEKDVNRLDAQGGRLSAMWRPSADFSVKLSALAQDSEVDGASISQPAIGDLEQDTLKDTGSYERRTQAYSAHINAKLGAVDLASLTGFSNDRFLSSLDLTQFFGGFAQQFFSVPNSLYTIDQEIKKLTQEVRLSSSAGRIDWLLGAFYTDETLNTHQEITAVTPQLGRAGDFIILPGVLSGILGVRQSHLPHHGAFRRAGRRAAEQDQRG